MAQAYTIDTGAEDAGAAVADAGPDFNEIYATADVAAGEKVFAKCKACHKVDGTNGTGPHLNALLAARRGPLADFAYSDGMKSVSDPWTPEHMQVFLANPKKYVAGTKMGFAGLPKIQDRANVIAYLATLDSKIAAAFAAVRPSLWAAFFMALARSHRSSRSTSRNRALWLGAVPN